MPNTTFIETNKLPRKQTAEGEVTEILNNELVGAKNVLGTLRWLKSGQTYKAEAGQKHQLIYLMEGNGKISLDNKEHEVTKGMGIYLAPSETATISPVGGATLKLFQLVVPRIPK
jgi:quercetin dioxygenase-like cupin family protein